LDVQDGSMASRTSIRTPSLQSEYWGKTDLNGLMVWRGLDPSNYKKTIEANSSSSERDNTCACHLSPGIGPPLLLLKVLAIWKASIGLMESLTCGSWMSRSSMESGSERP